jgi:hypothetical protein
MTTAVVIDHEDGTGEVVWELGADDDGDAAAVGRFVDKAVQATGTFGVGGEITIEGSNDGTVWAPLNDVFGEPIVLAAGNVIHQIAENPRFLRPVATDTENLDIEVRVFFATRGQ